MGNLLPEDGITHQIQIFPMGQVVDPAELLSHILLSGHTFFLGDVGNHVPGQNFRFWGSILFEDPRKRFVNHQVYLQFHCPF